MPLRLSRLWNLSDMAPLLLLLSILVLLLPPQRSFADNSDHANVVGIIWRVDYPSALEVKCDVRQVLPDVGGARVTVVAGTVGEENKNRLCSETCGTLAN